MLATLLKQPADQLDYDVDFTRWMTDDDTITTAVAVVTPADELTVQSVAVDGPIVKVWLNDGVSGSSYTVTVTASTDGGRVKEIDFRIRVRDCQ